MNYDVGRMREMKTENVLKKHLKYQNTMPHKNVTKPLLPKSLKRKDYVAAFCFGKRDLDEMMEKSDDSEIRFLNEEELIKDPDTEMLRRITK